MAATTNQAFWGFLWWIKHNPSKHIQDLTEKDLDAMSLAFTTVNATLCTFSTTDPGSYGTLQYPKIGGLSDAAGVTAAQTTAACEQSHYPDQHYGA
jgi:hypothetical protein